MIRRTYVSCPGCDQEFTLRLGISNWPGIRFFVPCPHCTLPIRARQDGNDPETYSLKFEAVALTRTPDPEPTPVVTVHPEVPSRYDTDSMTNPTTGTFPMMTLLSLLGDDTLVAMQVMAEAREVVANDWPLASRVYEYYLTDNKALLTKALGKLSPDLADAPTGTHHERSTIANNVLQAATMAIIGPRTESPKFFTRYANMHLAALRISRDYVRIAQELEDEGTLSSLQRSILDQLNSFVVNGGSWHIGILRRYLRDGAEDELSQLRMFRDEFDVLQNLYVQAFELVCKTLRFCVAARNVVKRGNPDCFDEAPPPGVSDAKRNPPSSLRKFDGLSNADKICYVRSIPGMERWVGCLDSKMRNAIGHASAQHDLRSGLIFSDKHSGGLPYLKLMFGVFDLFDALAVSAQIVRSHRVMASPDFGVGRGIPVI